MLTERQLMILKAIVDDYIVHAEPVGSRSVSKREDVHYSPATIRNEMADLEELGFLEKPHSSAGRIPSQKGYRYYVDHLLSPIKLSKNEVSDIRSLYEVRSNEIERVIQHSAKVLSTITNHTSIVLGPEMFETRLRQLQLIPLSNHQAVMIIVTDSGHVENQTVQLPKELDIQDLEKVVNILNERLRGVSLGMLHSKLADELYQVFKEIIHQHDAVIDMLSDVFKSHQHEKVFYGGKTNLLGQPEFNDIHRVRNILNIFEEDKLVSKLFRSEQSGLTVKIGEENRFEPFDQCTIITATYSLNGKSMGTVGIIGPTRMEYQKVISVMDYITKDLSKLLSSINK